MSKNNILMIENQLFQYNLIRSKLCEHFLIFPEESEFIRFADWTRITLTTRYNVNTSPDPNFRREKALDLIINYIYSKDIDLILMDHVLVGHHSGENGIHLANKLKLRGIDTPIIFLSRTPDNDEKVKVDIRKNNIKNPIWIEKGYAGQGIGDNWYFQEEVIKKIKTCINSAIGLQLDKLIDSQAFNDLITKINKARFKYWDKVQKDKLFTFMKKNPNLSIANIDELNMILDNVENNS